MAGGWLEADHGSDPSIRHTAGLRFSQAYGLTQAMYPAADASDLAEWQSVSARPLSGRRRQRRDGTAACCANTSTHSTAASSPAARCWKAWRSRG
ncbi:MAG: hypothetical protein R2856_19835 [Caldilineaceae bacterium]